MNNSTSLGALVAQALCRFSSRECLVHAGRRWAFAEVAEIVGKLTAFFTSSFSQGDRVGIFMSNRAEYFFLQLALERAGMVRVPLNARFTTHEARMVLEDCGAVALFFDSVTLACALTIAEQLPRIWYCQVDGNACANHSSWSDIINAGKTYDVLESVTADHICSINYTSGSSGKPKGVVLTHRNWSAVYKNMLVDRDIRENDVFAHIGPLTHSSGAYFLACFLRGACNVIIEGGAVDALLETIPREKITVFTCVPTVLTRIVNHPLIVNCDLSSIRMIGYGAEPIPFNTLEKALRRFGPILTQNYGLTEAMMTVTFLRPEDHFDDAQKLRVGCIGRPYTFVEVVLRKPDGTVVPTGEVGEITIRSEHVMKGYWNRPEETEKVLRGGWLWSGDLGSCDAAGFITLSGRSKDMLISGGVNIYPQEIEALLSSHASVLEAAVISIPNADWGEIAVAYVSTVQNSATDIEGLRTYCKPVLGIRTPKIFNIVDQLPKNPNGKIDKPALKELALRKFGESAHG